MELVENSHSERRRHTMESGSAPILFFLKQFKFQQVINIQNIYNQNL